MSKTIKETKECLRKDWEHGDELLTDKSICFTEAYATTFEGMEKGKADQFIFTSKNGTVSHTFIKRRIPTKIDNHTYYDIITPYGFGGPIVIETINEKLLLEEYFEAFHYYCVKNKIVSEFIRFHLFENNNMLEAFNGETVLANSVICRDLLKPLNQDVENRVLKDVLKAENHGLTIDFDYSGQSQLDFLKIYTETMDRNHATDFYYINQSFLNKLQDNLRGYFVYANTRLEGEFIASRLILFDKTYGYYFLGGNSREFYKYKNGTFLDYKLLIEMKNRGIEFYVFGGGHIGKDGIYRYKKKFDTKGEVPFHIGKKIHMEKEYHYLTSLRREKGFIDFETSFFPLYRVPSQTWHSLCKLFNNKTTFN